MTFRHCYSDMAAADYSPFRAGHSLPMKCSGPLPLSSGLLAYIKVEAEPNVRVDVRANVVQVEIRHARIGTIVPVPKADR
jgi:hypothetical protein